MAAVKVVKVIRTIWYVNVPDTARPEMRAAVVAQFREDYLTPVKSPLSPYEVLYVVPTQTDTHCVTETIYVSD